MKRSWIILILVIFGGCGIVRQQGSSSGRAAKKLEEARAHFEARNDAAAEESLRKALRADPDFADAYRMLAQICYDRGETEKAIAYYSRALRIDPEGNPDGYRLLAGLTYRNGEYERTLRLIDTFLAYPPESVTRRSEALLLREKSLFARDAIRDPVPFHPENLGDSVNSSLNEYWPSLSVDEQMLIFTVMLPNPAGDEQMGTHLQEDFFYSTRIGQAWSRRKNAGPPLNTPDNEGAQSVTADGNSLYFTACNRRSGMGRCDLYVSRKTGEGWSSPLNLGPPLNSRNSEKHPSVSADERVLYFASDRPGGKGSYDIWMSVSSNGTWGVPVNLGDSINTPGIEQSPFIHPDGQTLYFSSDGWPGMGQGDLFVSRLVENRAWSRPVNLGYPINTHHDEIGLVINAKGDRAYFASDRDPGRGTDLYTFELPREVRPVAVSYMTGRVYDAGNMKGLVARMQLVDLASQQVVTELESSPGEGAYLITLPTGSAYALNVSADGYLFYSGHFSFDGVHGHADPFRRDIPLERIEPGRSVVLNNLFFDTDSHTLKSRSVTELNRVYEFLVQYPGVSVEISGHTDDTGSFGYNQELSERRAGEVVSYLVGRGIDPERLMWKGRGEEEPVADNSTEEGRAKNRRTELKIIRIPDRDIR
ncbi:MAG TPA: tetratricopeptide repeat protein [Bacteroides sp.]|nr:tetratricopeptide repeat protein [Bacteroides sp.]